MQEITRGDHKEAEKEDLAPPKTSPAKKEQIKIAKEALNSMSEENLLTKDSNLILQ